MDASGENARALTSNAIEEGGVELSPDNSQVLFLADTNERIEPYYPNDPVRRAGGGRRRRGWCCPTTIRYAIEQAVWSPDGRSILANVNMGVHSELFLIDPAARPRAAADRRRAFHPARLGGRPERGQDRAAVRRADEVRRRVDAADRRSPGDARRA